MKIIEYNKINLIVLEILLSLFILFPFQSFAKFFMFQDLHGFSYPKIKIMFKRTFFILILNNFIVEGFFNSWLAVNFSFRLNFVELRHCKTFKNISHL